MLPPRNHWTKPANVPPSADTICIGAARPYIGGKNLAATDTPAFIVAGCCAMEIYTAAPKNVPQRNNAKNSTGNAIRAKNPFERKRHTEHKE